MTTDQIKAILTRRWALERAELAMRGGPEWAWLEVVAAHAEIDVPDGAEQHMDALRAELDGPDEDAGPWVNPFASYNPAA